MRESETVESFLKDSVKQLEEIKGVQQVGGNNVLYYSTSASEELYDYSTLLQGVNQEITVTFTFTNPEHYGIIYVNQFYRLDNPDVMANPEPKNTPTAPEVTVLGYEVKPAVDGQVQFVYTLINNTYLGIPQDFTVYLKFFFAGTSGGTVTIVPN